MPGPRWLLAILVSASLSTADEHEFRLYHTLMLRYNPLERPVQNNSLPVTVKLGLILQQIVGVDEKNQIIEVNAWIKYTWNDYKLHWNPEDYGGVTDVRFPVGAIWRPDVLVYNSADSAFDSTYPSNHVVYSNGDVLWVPPGILRTSCKIDIRWFPFDDQNCYIKFGSWTYHGFALDLQPEDEENGADRSEYLENGEWLLLSTPVARNEKFYDCCPEPYYDVKYYLNIRRRTLYYGFNLIIPSLLISLMTVLGFTLPPDAGEKITLEITILLSVCFFLSIVADMTPPTSEAVPLIGTFFTCCMVVVSASVVFTVVVLNLHYRTPDTHEMSETCKTLLLNWLPWLLMMRRPGHKFTPPPLLRALSRQNATQESESLMRNVRHLELNGGLEGSGTVTPQPSTLFNDGVHLNIPNAAPQSPGRRLTVAVADHRRESVNLESRVQLCVEPILQNPNSVDPGVQALILMLQKIHSELKFVVNRMEKEDVDEDSISDWKFAAMVVDRLCLIVFSAFIVASTCGIMFSAPHVTS